MSRSPPKSSPQIGQADPTKEERRAIFDAAIECVQCRSHAYQKRGDDDRVIRDYDEAIRIDPGYASAYNNRCWTYGLMRRPKDALPDCDEALRLLPDDPATLDSRALAYWQLDEHDKARLDLEHARQLNPSIPTWQERFREFGGMFE